MNLKRIFYGEDENQFGDLRLPDGNGPFPVAIIIHGGFWREKFRLDQMDRLAEELTARGIATWNIEYRRIGQTGGGWPGTFLDNAEAADYVRTLAIHYPLDVDRVIAIGHSAGGHLALWMAARQKLSPSSMLTASHNPLHVKGVISLAGVGDLALMHEIHYRRELNMGIQDNPTRDLLGGRPDDVPGRYEEGSPQSLLPIEVPLVLIHGFLDVNVPIGVSMQFEAAAKLAGDKVLLKTIADAEHFSMIDPTSAAWPEIMESIHSMLHDE